MVGVNIWPRDRGKILFSIFEINHFLSRWDAPFRLRESIVQATLLERQPIHIRAWDKLHMKNHQAIYLVRGAEIPLAASHAAQAGICIDTTLDALGDDPDAGLMLFKRWHLRPCRRHRAIGLVLHMAGHTLGYNHYDKGVMNPEGHQKFPNVKPPKFRRKNNA